MYSRGVDCEATELAIAEAVDCKLSVLERFTPCGVCDAWVA